MHIANSNRISTKMDMPDANVTIEPMEDKTKVRPKQQIRLLGAVSFGMGTVIGSGIFISPTGALKYTGSMGGSLLAWSVSGILSIIIGLVIGELGSIIPRSGGEFTYIDTAIGSLPAFIAATLQPLVSSTASMATLALVLANYLTSPFFDDCGPPEEIRKLIAVTVIITLGITNCISVKFAESTQIVFTIAKFSALCLITVTGFVRLGQGESSLPEDAFEGSATDVKSYVLAIYSCMFAYSGVQAINMIAEELVEPKRNIPRSIILTLCTVTGIYIVTNISYFIVLDKDEFLHTKAVAYSWALKAINPAAIIIPISVVCSVFGAINGGIFGGSRVLFAAARAGHLPEVMSYLNVNSLIPVPAVLTECVVAIALLIPADISQLINFLSCLNFIIYLLTSIALIILKWRRREIDDDVFRTPMIVPIMAVLICLFLIIAPLASNPGIEFLFAIAAAAGSLILYFPLVYFNLAIPGVNTLTVLSQMLTNSCPTERVDMIND